jgi:hypothetical protein
MWIRLLDMQLAITFNKLNPKRVGKWYFQLKGKIQC